MDKKQVIIESAITVFAQKGLEKGKIADIAKEAGIGKGTVYEYFKSKDEIFQSIEKSLFEDFHLLFQEINVESFSPAEKLETLIRTGLDKFVEMGESMLILTELWAQAGRGHWHGTDTSQFNNYYNQFKDGVKSILDAGVKFGDFRKMNQDGVAALLMAFMDGLVWQLVLMKDNKSFQIIKEEAIQSFMRGILMR